MNFQHIVKNAQEGVSVTVFFNEGTSQERIDAIGEQIKARVEVSNIKYTTADEAWAWFQENISKESTRKASPPTLWRVMKITKFS